MIRVIAICTSLAALAACSALPSTDRVEADIALACASPTVKAKLPSVCADPARYAKDAAVAAQVFQAARDAVQR